MLRLCLKLFLFLACFSICVNSLSQNFNRPVTPELFPYEFQKLDSTLDIYYALGTFKLGSTPSDPEYIQPKAVILDSDGYNVWYGAETSSRIMSDFKYDSILGQFLVITRSSGLTVPNIIDTNFNIINQFSPVNSDYIDGHDFKSLNDGNMIILGIKDSVFDLSSILINGGPGNPSTVCRCNTLEIIDNSNTLIWEWNSCDYIHPSESYDFYNYDPSSYDYAHFNSVYEDDDGNFLMSFRHLNAVIKISRATGNIIWQLGGKSSDFIFTNDTGFSGQHNAERRPSGFISVLDNGNMSGPPEVSRGVEYSLDTIAWTATLVEEYLHTPSIYSPATGSYYRWNDSKTINYGRAYRPDPSIVVADELNQIQALVFFQDTVMSYRAQPFKPKFSFDRPSVSCLDSIGSTFLIAESGHSSYLWSTGETTQSIEPQSDTSYQVWVPQGIGKISSEPIHFNSAYCTSIGINELVNAKPFHIKTIDLLGREVKKKEFGQIYIDLYSDGSIKKSILRGPIGQ